MKKLFCSRFMVFLMILIFIGLQVSLIQAASPWMDTTKTASERADLLVAAMTNDQKVVMCHGASGSYTGNVPGNTTLGIPTLNMSDGPSGARVGSAGNVTCFPAPINLACTWDDALAQTYGQVYGAEQKGKGTNVALAPMMNVLRVPQAGRNWEGYGEDPYLSAQLAAAEVVGIQSNGILACAKHFICNDQETNRGSASSEVDDRTLHEIYLPAFEACVNAGVGSVMGAYNKVNGTYSCENSYILNSILYGELGYTGFVMSDWGATHSTVASANNGLAQEQPGSSYFGSALTTAVQNGQVSQAQLNLMVKRILVPMFQLGLFDRAPSGSTGANVTSAAHTQVAQDVAAQGMVLLKNINNVLPFTSSVTKIAVIGTAASTSPIVCGGGSGSVPYSATQLITALEGLTSRAGAGITVSYNDGSNQASAATLAGSSNVAIVVVGCNASEGSDRANLSFPSSQGDSLINAVAAANSKTIVVMYAPCQMLMPWATNANVAAILYGGIPGIEQGNALAKVLFGDVNPSGKLPFTIAVNASDYNPAAPGTGSTVPYTEKLLVGYRGFDQNNKTPLYPFGHGLSYTTFTYSNLNASSSSVSFTVTNNGSRTGAEVAQLYLGFPGTAGEPPKQLKGFKKVTLMAGGNQTVTLPLTSRDLSTWDATTKKWVAASGIFNVYVGSSSRDIRLTGSFQVNAAAKNIPGTIEAESYDNMYGIQTEATTDTGGGLDVGWIETGDWMDYNVNVQTAGTYTVQYRVASTTATGQIQLRKADGTILATTSVPNTGGWQVWTTVTANVTLAAGAQVIRLYAGTGGFNVNWLSFTITTTLTPTPTPTVIPTPTPTATPTASSSSLLSQGKTATASSYQTGNLVANGNDGSLTTRWAAVDGTYPQWWKVDLGAAYPLRQVGIYWYNSSSRAYKYKIEVSSDNVTFTTVVDKTGNTAYGDTSDFFAATARYVRVTVTGCSAANAYASAFEFKVYGI